MIDKAYFFLCWHMILCGQINRLEARGLGKKRGRGIAEMASEIFDIPGEAAGTPRVTITGTSRVHVENHRGLLEYSPQRISVNAGRMVIKINGENLELAAMSDMELVVTGSVMSVEYIV